MSARLVNTWGTSKDNWVLNLEVIDGERFLTSNSNGKLDIYDINNINDAILSIKAHESSINSLKTISSDLAASCSSEGVKVVDLRSGSIVHRLSNPNASPFLSLDYRNNLLASGTELVGSDAELHIWDIRNPNEPVKSYVDSHHDDITAIQFHPSSQYSNYLMSGSTDGYVNIYDLNEKEEDDALHQVINYLSVHSCHFISPNRIGILSHMETLSFHELNNTNYEVWDEPTPNDLGDVRELWNCEYVVNLNPLGYISYGSNSVGELYLRTFNPSQESFGDVISFPRAHGDEVVRDVKVVGKNVLTCGEDGSIKLWELPSSIELQEWKVDEDHNDDIQVESPTITTNEEPKKHKSKKDKHSKKHKKKKDKKKDIRFKPY